MQWIIENFDLVLKIGFPSLTLGGLIVFFARPLFGHWLSDRRSEKNFERQQQAKRSEANETALSLLGILANSVLNCWEEARIIEAYCRFGRQDQIVGEGRDIVLNDYDEIKSKLIQMNVFPARTWHVLDKLPSAVNDFNARVRTLPKAELYIRAHHFSNHAEGIYQIIVGEYDNRGGDVSTLTRPMLSPRPKISSENTHPPLPTPE